MEERGSSSALLKWKPKQGGTPRTKHARCWDRSAVLRKTDAWKLALVCSVPTARVTLREASSLQSPLHCVPVELAHACQNETVCLQ